MMRKVLLMGRTMTVWKALPPQTGHMDHDLNDEAILGLDMLLMDGVGC